MRQHLGGSQLLALQDVQLAESNVNAVDFPWLTTLTPFGACHYTENTIRHGSQWEHGSKCGNALMLCVLGPKGVQSLSWIQGHVFNGPQGKGRPPQLLIVCCCAANRHWLPLHHDEHPLECNVHNALAMHFAAASNSCTSIQMVVSGCGCMSHHSGHWSHADSRCQARCVQRVQKRCESLSTCQC